MTQLLTLVDTLGIAREHTSAFASYIELFVKWNERINLSAAKDAAQVEEHVRDSLHVVPLLGCANRVIDVGSGGGFPVIPAAICLPNTSFVALEPVHKKHAFLRTAARELQLANLTCYAQRAEDHEADDYDVAMSRATFDLAEWLELGSSLVLVGGIVIGFEAIERVDLPNTVTRVEYDLDGKRRALIRLQRAS